MEYKAIKLKENSTDEEILQQVNDLNKSPKNSDVCEYLDIKNETFEVKEKVFKILLEADDIQNHIFFINMLNLIKGYNDFDEAFFSEEVIYFKEITDYLDIRINLSEEVEAFKKKVALYYLSLFASANKVEYTVLDNCIELPTFMRYLFSGSNLITISGIIADIKDLEIPEFLQIKDAYYYLDALVNKFSFSNSLIEELNVELSKENTDGE